MPLLLFLAWPLAEIAGFILVGRAIGVLPTLVLTIAISALGLSLLREAGAATIARLQQGVRAPAVILAQGGIRMGAGLLLLIPGFITDIAAVALLLIPGFITDIAAVALLLFGGGRAIFGGRTPVSDPVSFSTPTPPASGPAIDPAAIGGATIEGDFRRVDN